MDNYESVKNDKLICMIILDVETTGLDPQKHSVVSLGAIEFEKPERQYYQECRIWDGAEIDQLALDINGFAEADIRDPNKRSLKEILEEFIDWSHGASDRTLAGENVWYDWLMLQASSRRYGLSWPFAHRIVDLHSVCRAHIMSRGLKPPLNEEGRGLVTDAILEYAGLPHREGFHNALADAKLEAEAFSRLIFGKGKLAEFNNFTVPKYFKR